MADSGIMTIGNVEARFEVCAAHAVNFTKATLINWAMRKGLSALGVRLLKVTPVFEFRVRRR